MRETDSARVLVVVRDATERRILSVRFGAAGHEVHVAGDGNSGLELARKVQPEVVLCDDVLGSLDGIEYCRRVKEDPALRSIWVLLLTEEPGWPRRVAALEAGADCCLTKPVATEELLARIRAGLRTRRLLRELAAEQHRAALREMAATLGHEVNNPLTALFGHLELVIHHLEQGKTERMRHHLQEASSIAARIGRVGHRLMSLVEPRMVAYLGERRMLDLGENETVAASAPAEEA